MVSMLNFAWAQAAQAAPEAPAASQSPMGGIGGLLPLVLVFVIFYFLLIRPQQKKDKEHKKMLVDLNKGDYILTSGGIYGTIIGVKTDAFELKVDDNVKLLITRNSIAQVVRKQGAPPPPAAQLK